MALSLKDDDIEIASRTGGPAFFGCGHRGGERSHEHDRGPSTPVL
jgi:hypothetical protein